MHNKRYKQWLLYTHLLHLNHSQKFLRKRHFLKPMIPKNCIRYALHSPVYIRINHDLIWLFLPFYPSPFSQKLRRPKLSISYIMFFIIKIPGTSLILNYNMYTKSLKFSNIIIDIIPFISIFDEKMIPFPGCGSACTNPVWNICSPIKVSSFLSTSARSKPWDLMPFISVTLTPSIHSVTRIR